MKKLLSILLTLTMVMGALVVVPFTASAETLDDHLITHWNFAGDDPWADKATNGNNPDTMIPYGGSYASNGTAYIPEYTSQNGANSYIFADNSNDLMRTTEDRTIYVKFKSSKGDFANDGKDSNWVEIAGQNGAIRVGIAHNDNKLFVSTNVTSTGENWAQTAGMTTFTADTWTTVAISYDKDISTGKIKILTCFKTDGGDWITGSVTQTDTTQTWVQDDLNTDVLYSLIFGRRYTSLGSPWSGNLTYDDIRIYDKALTADEVKSIVVSDEDPSSEPEVPVDIADYLLTHWDFAGDEPLADKATNGTPDTMILMNYATLQNDGTVLIPDNKNNTNNHYMYAADSADLLRTTEDRTIYIVFKSSKGDFANDSENDYIELVGQNGALRAGINSSNNLFASTNSHTQGENYANTTGMNTFVANTWTTVALSYKKDIATNSFVVTTFFKVGENDWIVGSVTKTDATQTWQEDNSDAGQNDTEDLVFGRRTYSFASTWGGDLTFDDIRIYGMALNAEQVASIEITNPAPTAPTVETAGHSLSLSGDIGVNFFLTPNATALNAKVTIKNGDAVLVENASFDAAHKDGNTDDYKFTANVSAKEMADELTLTVMNGDTQIYTETYSVRKYGLYILENSANYTPETVALVKAMLLYGGCAQTYFAYNTENGYAEGIGDLSQITKDSKYDASVSGNIAGLTVEAATLMLETKAQIVVALKAESSPLLVNYTFAGGTAVKQGDYIYVTTDGICVQDLEVMQTITITSNNDATQKIQIKYSPMTFIQEMADNKGDTAIDTLVRAMYDYWVAAEAYIATPNA